MEADDSWAFYIRTADHFLHSTEGDSGEALSAILAEADDLRKVGDGLGALIVKWESIHEPVKLPKTWSRTPADLAGLAGDYNDRISEIEEALQGDALKLEALGEALGSPAWRRSILKKIEKAESEVSEITELLLKLFRDVPNELGRVKTGAASGSPEASAAVVALETAVAEATESFLKSAKAEDLSLEGLQSLLSNAGNAAFVAIRSAEQALEDLKAAEDQQRQQKDEEKPAKKTTKKSPAVPTTWFYLNDTNEAQQADLSVLADLIKDDILTQQSHVWREGWAEWREMGQVEELAKLFGGKRPKSPPPLPGGSTRRAGDTAVFAGIEFVWCPPGTFMMGFAEGELESGYSNQHQVTLTRGFWIGKYPVTQAQWVKVMGDNPSGFRFDGQCLEAPVDNVSWEDAQVFCSEVSSAEGIQLRLPTEAEWEYACRAGSTGAWCFGDDEEMLGEYAWFEANSGMTNHPVGQKKPNAWGIHDMHGNVFEWCHDWFDDYSKGPTIDPVGPKNGSGRVYRGGSYSSEAIYCRSACREGITPDYIDYQSFRVTVSSAQVEELAKLFEDRQLRLVPSLTSIVEKLVPFMSWHKCYLNCDIGHYPPKPEFKKKSIGASSYIKNSVTISGAKAQPSDEEIFFIWDHTLFGSAEKGMSISKSGIFWFAGHGQKHAWFYPFSSIRNVYLENGLIVFKFGDESTHKWHVIVAAVLDCEASTFVEGLANLAKYHEDVLAYAMRAVSDPVTDELIAVLSNNQAFSLDNLRAVVYKRLKALNADLDVEPVIHLRTYEKLLNLVNRGLVEKKGSKYRKYRG